eukprot:8393322-Alexandrium_andersonii.AAC.1
MLTKNWSDNQYAVRTEQILFAEIGVHQEWIIKTNYESNVKDLVVTIARHRLGMSAVRDTPLNSNFPDDRVQKSIKNVSGQGITITLGLEEHIGNEML